MCSDPMPSHNLLNRHAFSGHNFMKFIALTASFKTEAHLLGSSSLKPGLLCITQCVHRVSGFFCRMCAIRPLMRPIIDAAASVSAHTGTGFPADFMF